jgi:hypothetical protein
MESPLSSADIRVVKLSMRYYHRTGLQHWKPADRGLWERQDFVGARTWVWGGWKFPGLVRSLDSQYPRGPGLVAPSPLSVVCSSAAGRAKGPLIRFASHADCASTHNNADKLLCSSSSTSLLSAREPRRIMRALVFLVTLPCLTLAQDFGTIPSSWRVRSPPSLLRQTCAHPSLPNRSHQRLTLALNVLP